ncbi:MAG: glutamate--cysteine ligase [Gammaproteobacteria bacterium]|nr:glutamate--cysteine ligase [Gammaproteobacteria bacterium]
MRNDRLFRLADSNDAEAIFTFNRGIEREALRIQPSGLLADTAHPAEFGSKLAHSLVTTDFSESQLEIITPVHTSSEQVLTKLEKIHQHVYQGLESELLWPGSMPCILPADETIPLAYYGDSNLGRLKTTYRNGLGLRYGRSMQTICAIHYNFSPSSAFWSEVKKSSPDETDQTFRSRRYFDLMRNFRRLSWLPLYLFGSSPALHKSFIQQPEHDLDLLDAETLYMPFATSLRSGRFGYQSTTQADLLNTCFNSLDNYIDTLRKGITTPHQNYRELGFESNTGLNQLNRNILQSEAEFYTSVRAKGAPQPGENFLSHLKDNGVSYIEVRLLDVNPFEPSGIRLSQIDFLDLLLMYCLLSDSPQHDASTCEAVTTNFMRTVYEGRKSDLKLDKDGADIKLVEWAKQIFDELRSFAEVFDRVTNSHRYTQSLDFHYELITDSQLTPSGRVLAHLQNTTESYKDFSLRQAENHKNYFSQLPLTTKETESFKKVSAQSVETAASHAASTPADFRQYAADFQAAYRS